jgi:GNAT superfamily N-acetyltransferase
MKCIYAVGLARPEYVDALSSIELAAARMLQGCAPASVLLETTPRAEFELARCEGRLWVAVCDETPVGFAYVGILADGMPHLQEMDVVPGHGRRGVGAALLKEVLAWLANAGHRLLTLTTFRDVPWNMPFYARMGFVEVATHDMRPALEAIVRDEAERGLDRSRRVVMGYRVGSSEPEA